MNRTLQLIATCITPVLGSVLGVSGAHGGIVPSFTGLDDLPGGNYLSRAWDVSADGSVVVGESHSGQGQQAFRWTASGGMLGLGDLPGGSFYSFATGVSGNGAVVVGGSNSASGRQAFRWNATSGMTTLVGGAGDTDALAASFDGSLVVGRWGEGAFRWTAADGVGRLGDLGIVIDNFASDVSADGTVIVGQARSPQGYEAFRWTQATGTVGLGGVESSASAISADGTVIVGRGRGFEAFRWTIDEGITFLGDLPGAPVNSVASAVSGDGSIIVGTASNADDGLEAFIWNEQAGMRSLRDLLVQEYGLDLAGWTLNEATGISLDGRVIIGSGYSPNGYEAWRAVVPEPNSLFLLLIGVGAVHSPVRRRRRRASR